MSLAREWRALGRAATVVAVITAPALYVLLHNTYDWPLLWSLVGAFAAHHSLSLQQTLYEMGAGVLRARPEIAEVRLSLPNRHHFVVDLSAFGLDNDNQVFRAEDRPYGLIEAVLSRDDAPPAGPAWDPYPLVR